MSMNERASFAYECVARFLDQVNARDAVGLARDFGIGHAIYDEVIDALSGYFDEIPAWSPPPDRGNAGGADAPGFDLYEMHEADVWGLECRLWHGGKRAEPILHAEFTEDANGLAMHFKYIEN
ncbi:hypothetical protein [Burkholderia ubonensis]|uniref:hypothetical protein n=1 Tax=Burkholderia ubonensis TaxID=101571 RepID=UPI000A75C16F|nr:hypothetical protein [Burkholderia ubonensis]